MYRFFGTTGVDCVFTVVFCVRRPFCGKAAILFLCFSPFSLLLLWCFVLVPIYLTFIAVF